MDFALDSGVSALGQDQKMSLWSRLQQLPPEGLRQVHQLYGGEHFPIEVRCALAEWIEMQPWNDLDADNPQHEQYFSNLIPTMVNELQMRAQNCSADDLVLRFRLSDAATSIQNNYGHDPYRLVNIIKRCLQNEMHLIHQHENVSGFACCAAPRC